MALIESIACANDESAQELDSDLRFLMGADTQVQRAMGVLLGKMLSGENILRLGYALAGDYTRERLGLSLREAEELAWIEKRLAEYPETDRMWREGKITRCHVRLILRRTKPEDDFTWARLATVMSVRALDDRLPGQEESCILERLDVDLTPEMRVKFEAGLELVRRLMGSDISQAQFIEYASSEFHSGARQALFDALEAEEADRPVSDWRSELERLRSEAERAAEQSSGRWSALSWDAPRPACIPDFTVPPDADGWALDECLRAAVRFRQELHGLVTRRLWQTERWQVHRLLGFSTFIHYSKERLGLSETTAYGLLRLQRALLQSPVLREAYETGVLTKSKAEQVARVVTPATAEAWVEYGRQTTVRKLRDVVAKAAQLRKEDPVAYRNMLPPEPRTCASSPAAQALLEESLAQVASSGAVAVPPASSDGPDESSQRTCAAPYPRVPEEPYQVPYTTMTRLSLGMPQDMFEWVQTGLGLARMALGGKATVSQCVDVLLDGFLAEWSGVAEEAGREHPIQERDGWRCQSPGCTSRASLQGHHVVYRSRGGKDDDDNQETICAPHHLKGIHEGRMKAAGLAPDDVVWVLGIRPNGVPSQILLGDTILYSD